MILQIHAQIIPNQVDRDSVANRDNDCREGFNVHFSALTIHWEDEADAVEMAKMILKRMGQSFDPNAVE